jgi:replication initiation and membrane attachment protein DnaB
MTITIPQEIYTMQAKRSIIKTNARKYRKATKKMKSAILNDLVNTTHLDRKYLTTMLNNTGKVFYTPQGVKLGSSRFRVGKNSILGAVTSC